MKNANKMKQASIEKAYNELLERFEQYKKESIKWSVWDLLEYEHDTHTIGMEDAQKALEDMIRNHDPNDGITWDTIYYYIEKYGTLKP